MLAALACAATRSLTPCPRRPTLRRLGGGLDLRLRGDAPHIVGNLAAAAQLLNVSLPGQEPLRMEDVKEDTRLLLGGAALAGGCRARGEMQTMR